MLNFNYFYQDLNLCSGNIQYAIMWLPLHAWVQYLLYFVTIPAILLDSVYLQTFSDTHAKFHVFSNFGHFHVFFTALDYLTQNWVQFIHFSSVEA